MPSECEMDDLSLSSFESALLWRLVGLLDPLTATRTSSGQTDSVSIK